MHCRPSTQDRLKGNLSNDDGDANENGKEVSARFKRRATAVSKSNNLTRQLHGSCTAVAREWFQASNLIQSRQIQHKESVAIRRIRVKTLTHIYIFMIYELSSTRQ